MEVYLTQSSEFALEMELPGVSDCYCIAPSFRADKSHTRRHLTEFTHAEVEWGGITSFQDHLDKIQAMLTGILTHFAAISHDTLQTLGVYDNVVKFVEMSKDIVILQHCDAIKKLAEFGIYRDPDTKTHFDSRDDIPEAQERELIDKIGKIVFLVKFPKEFKSFYMALDADDPSYVLGCDVEVPGVGEIIGSGVREGDVDRLRQRMLDAKLDPDDYREYLDLRKFGFAQTSGMGLGVGRMLTWLLGAHTIRDVVVFPRFPGYARP
jgi:asparaginyl-tRNA synthetase